jgi:hypoxanthine phosphoribosyltransferase
MKLLDKEFNLMINRNDLEKRIDQLANEINIDYNSKAAFFIAVLNGSFIFAADLLRKIAIPCEISFIKLASYESTSSTGNVKKLIGVDQSLKGKNVIIIEDIIDSGLTLSETLPEIELLGPSSIQIVSLLFKSDNLEKQISPKYVGFRIPSKFVIGYGLDYDGFGRNLNEIYQEL